MDVIVAVISPFDICNCAIHVAAQAMHTAFTRQAIGRTETMFTVLGLVDSYSRRS